MFVIRLYLRAVVVLLAFACVACHAKPPYNLDVTFEMETGLSQCGATAVGPHTVLTASHCLADVRVITLDGLPYDVVSVTHDGADHALIRVEGTFKRWAKRGDPAKVGDAVYFRGSPRGFTPLYRWGQVSGHYTEAGDRFTLYDMQVAPGDSGSGVFNDDGELVGVVSVLTLPFTAPANFMGSIAFKFDRMQWKRTKH